MATRREDLIWFPKQETPVVGMNTRLAQDELTPGEMVSISNFSMESLGALTKIKGNVKISSSTLTVSTSKPDDVTMLDAYKLTTNPTGFDLVNGSFLADTILVQFPDAFFAGLTGTVQSSTLTLKSIDASSYAGTGYKNTAAWTEADTALPTKSTTDSMAIIGSGAGSTHVFNVPTNWIDTWIADQADNHGIQVTPTATPSGKFYSSLAVDIGLFMGGGLAAPDSNVIDYIDVGDRHTNNALDIGDLSLTRRSGSHVGDATYVYMMGGVSNFITSAIATNVIDYLSANTLVSSVTDGGDLAVARGNTAGVSGATYGFSAGGENSTTVYNEIEYITLATGTQDALDTGNLTVARYSCAGVGLTGTKCFIGGGVNAAFATTNVIDYISGTSATENATDTGDLIAAAFGLSGLTGPVRGFFLGGNVAGVGTNTIQYITLATASQNATDGGDLITAASYLGSTGCSGSAFGSIAQETNIEALDLTTLTGNATDTGDLSVSRFHAGGV